MLYAKNVATNIYGLQFCPAMNIQFALCVNQKNMNYYNAINQWHGEPAIANQNRLISCPLDLLGM